MAMSAPTNATMHSWQLGIPLRSSQWCEGPFSRRMRTFAVLPLRARIGQMDAPATALAIIMWVAVALVMPLAKLTVQGFDQWRGSPVISRGTGTDHTFGAGNILP